MPYEITLRFESQDSPESTWVAAINTTEGVRPVTSEWMEGCNPRTGEIMRMKCSLLDAEVYLPSEDEWVRALYWRKSKVSVNGRFVEFGDLTDPGWRAVSSLAQRLGAVIQGEEGEIYDSVTGRIVRDPFGREI